jgi:digeranylgeranylglycerophospholipid reductase
MEAAQLDYDVMVVGAGPAGSTVAYQVAKHGFKVLVVEEHPQVGVPSHCTGKLSISAAKELGIKPPRILAELRGAIFHSPSGIQLTVERAETQAYILDRGALDWWLASEAENLGATLATSTRANKVEIGKSGVRVYLASKRGVETKLCKVVVGADGVASFVARQMGLYSKKPVELRLAAQKEFSKVKSMIPDFAELFFGERIAPGFFAWTVPAGSMGARVGLCIQPLSGQTPARHLDQFIASNPVVAPKLRESVVTAESVHAIPTGGAIRRTVCDGTLIVGDAAGQVKSTTGGGLYYGILCARIAGESLCKALERSEATVPGEELLSYERNWRERLGEEISFGCRVRNFMDSLSDDEVNYLFQVLRNDKTLSTLVEALADIDYQSRIGKSLIPRIVVALARKPRLLSKARHLLVS